MSCDWKIELAKNQPQFQQPLFYQVTFHLELIEALDKIFGFGNVKVIPDRVC